MVKIIDINSDLGENAGNDLSIMPYISSCNIACGGHAGDQHSVVETIKLAHRHQVKIGAHPSYPDRENFGRKTMDLAWKDLESSVLNQISLVKHEAQNLNLPMHHIKLHGALYNLTISDASVANLMARLIKQHFPDCLVYAPYLSEMSRAAKSEGLGVKYEVFADRNYLADLRLVNRDHPEAMIKTIEEINQHVIQMVENRVIRTLDGSTVKVIADTICLHGDNPEAVAIANSIFHLLKDRGYHFKGV